MSTRGPLHLFEGFGVELEYMIVASDSLDVRPIADELLRAAAGGDASDVDRGPVSWSNELVSHVIELKTNGPAATLQPLGQQFAEQVRDANALLAPLGARLMPTAMHPWMDPWRETKLWQADYSEVYEAYNRIFNCQGHGWSNLQSVHLNLPFASDEEFARLHAAIRLLLPILPALAASSPIYERRASGWLDTRMEMYRTNSRKIPSLTGRVIPEPVFNEADYRQQIFERIYADIAPHDPDELLRDEFLNSRGAIARFGRGAIEIRVLDVQECPSADVAICAAIAEVLKRLTSEETVSLAEQQSWSIDRLEPILLATIRDGEAALIADADYWQALGAEFTTGGTAGDLWRQLLSPQLVAQGALAQYARPLTTILDHGPLARRILKATGHGALQDVYARLCDCLANNELFLPG